MQIFLHNEVGISFECPENWEAKEENGIASVNATDAGIGVLQLSFYHAPDSGRQALREMLDEFLTPRHGEILVENINGRQHVDLIDQEGTSWQYWLFAVGEVVVFATYNCQAGDRGKEDAIVMRILQSVDCHRA